MEIDNHESKPALTPPTSESTGKKDDDDSGSELSELEPEESVEEPEVEPQIKEEIEEEIVPDHYYEGGKVPVFKPVSNAQNIDIFFPCGRERKTADGFPDDEAVSEFQRLYTKNRQIRHEIWHCQSDTPKRMVRLHDKTIIQVPC